MKAPERFFPLVLFILPYDVIRTSLSLWMKKQQGDNLIKWSLFGTLYIFWHNFGQLNWK